MIDHMFQSVVFQVSLAQFRELCRDKATVLLKKVAERRGRVLRLREEHSITDSELIRILSAAASDSRAVGNSYAYSADNGEERVIGAGAVAALLSEQKLIESETRAVQRLRRMGTYAQTYNLYDSGTCVTVTTIDLSDHEAEYLGLV